VTARAGFTICALGISSGCGRLSSVLYARLLGPVTNLLAREPLRPQIHTCKAGEEVLTPGAKVVSIPAHRSQARLPIKTTRVSENGMRRERLSSCEDAIGAVQRSMSEPKELRYGTPGPYMASVLELL
jgi:hypothetical protein